MWSRPGLARAGLDLAGPVSRLFPVGPAPLAARPFRQRVRRGDAAAEPATIFASCLVDRLMPEAGEALNRILLAAGLRVEFPPDQWCCGLICSNAGDFERGGGLFRRLAASLEASEGPIVTPSASCFGAVTIDSADWDGDGHPATAAVRARMRDSTRFVLDLLEARPSLVAPAPKPRLRIAYHDSCQSKRQLGLVAEPRRVLELAGYEVVEVP